VPCATATCFELLHIAFFTFLEIKHQARSLKINHLEVPSRPKLLPPKHPTLPGIYPSHTTNIPQAAHAKRDSKRSLKIAITISCMCNSLITIPISRPAPHLQNYVLVPHPSSFHIIQNTKQSYHLSRNFLYPSRN
jgi:hypothetical protein